jgi:transcriptional regulator with XRE-family HTH domain
MKEPASLALLVQFLRSLRGWTQAQLAEAVGLDPSTICRYEQGDSKPRRKNLEKIATAVGVSMPLVDACFLPAMEAACATASLGGDPRFEELEGPAADLGGAVAGAVQSAAAAFLAGLEASNLWEKPGPPSSEDRLAAADAWERLEPCSFDEALFLIESCQEFQNWALAERLCRESTDRPDRAVELAELAVRVARRAPGDELWRSRLEGYALGYLVKARVQRGLPVLEETAARATALWEAGAPADPGLLAPS